MSFPQLLQYHCSKIWVNIFETSRLGEFIICYLTLWQAKFNKEFVVLLHMNGYNKSKLQKMSPSVALFLVQDGDYMGRTVGIGLQNFEKIREKKLLYIDKTMFNKEWWEAEDEVTLITRP